MLPMAGSTSGRSTIHHPQWKVNTMTANSWQLWASLSAAFAALTAIFAKVGVEGVNSDFATFYRTAVVMATLAVLLLATGQFEFPKLATGKTYFFLTLSGLATGAS